MNFRENVKSRCRTAFQKLQRTILLCLMISKPLSDVEINHPFNVVLVHEHITKRHLKTT